MLDPVTTAEGLTVVHLFCKRTASAEDGAIVSAVEAAQAAGVQVVTVAVLGHKAELCFMALHREGWPLRDLQTALVNAGLEVVDSFVSITELSEYALGLGEDMKNMRLYPELPPAGKSAWCFYPMTKRREDNQNWYRLTFDERKELMYEHGTSGRKFAGRIVQLITASTGLDDWEWGVTLFGTNLDDLKDTVYTMRYDTASAIYAEFGPFYTGLVGSVVEIVERTS
ncbi:MAG: chlorite dismutase [Acidimicrobiaceae bacterium]|nr:chlorite dismutase [Acidimicrobiaceae bacterium]MYC41740.1 chlorite dismutase [Acidimicrobiaceae bacterium]MYH88826.1 chlorite dismutase [Acidimicrobiaceae bacterium]